MALTPSCAKARPEMIAALFLLRTANVAFLGDLSQPSIELVEVTLGSRYGIEEATRFLETIADMRAGWDEAVYEAAGLPAPTAWKRSWSAVINGMGDRLTATEARELLGEEAAKWPGFRRGLTRPADRRHHQAMDARQGRVRLARIAGTADRPRTRRLVRRDGARLQRLRPGQPARSCSKGEDPMTEILTSGPIKTFANGRNLRQTLAGDTVTDGVAKDGSPRTLAYGAGAVVLAGPTGELLAGPLDLDGAEALAVAVIEGDARVLTSPGIELRLASALLALIGNLTPRATAEEARHVQA
jgi:hypothetical protein